MEKMIEYSEPWPTGPRVEDWVEVTIRMTEESAVKLQRWSELKRNPANVYPDDESALDDFKVIHWATPVVKG